MSKAGEITKLLDAGSGGDAEALNQAFALVYDELRAIAAALLGNERRDHTLQPTALVHEVFLRLVGDAENVTWQNRAHFFGIAARSMRQILVNYARARSADKRGGANRPITLDAALDALTTVNLDVLELHDALERLAKLNETQARIVELRFFGGLTHEETAEVLQISERTVRGNWDMAKTWLYRELKRS